MIRDSFKLLHDYLFFRLNSKPKGGFGVHSPFVFDLYTKVIQNDFNKAIFEEIEKIRKSYRKNTSEVLASHYGAGSRIGNRKLTFGTVAHSISVPPYLGRLLHRLTVYYQPKTILELGTSLGFSTMYIASGNSSSKLISIEGDVSLAENAMNNFNKVGLANITIIQGDFNVRLPEFLDSISTVDMAFIDGDHSEESILRYYNLIKKKAGDNSIFIFDDIRWSKGMGNAWAKISGDNEVSISIDLFRCGIVLFRKGIIKQHFLFRFGPY